MLEQTNQFNWETEIQLIIECSQTLIKPSKIKKICSLLRRFPNWNYIFKVAERNAVTPLISWNLIQRFDHCLPPEVRNAINSNFQEHMRKNMFLTGKLLEIIELFKSNGILILPFKGPLLAIQCYGNLALRKFGDLDILIQLEDLKRATELLKENSFEPVSDLNWLHKNNFGVSRKKDVVFIDRKNGVILELHWKLSGSHFAMPLEINRLWKESETRIVAGREIDTFSFNDLLIYLCLHGSRHGWERFGWICDINELIRSKEDIDWEQISSDAKRLGCENALNFGLFLVHEFFGKNLSLRDWETIVNNHDFMEIARHLRANLFTEDYAALKIGERYSYHLKLKEKLWDRCKLHLHYNLWYLKIIFSPNEADEGSFHLPPRFAPLYYIMRPPRLVYTYLLKPKKTKNEN